MNINLIVIIAILATSALAHSHDCKGLPPKEHQAYEEITKAQGFDVITDDHLRQREEIAATGTYRPMKIMFDLTSLNKSLDENGMSDRKAFYEQVFRITGKWWENALFVNDDRSSIWPRIKANKDYYVPRGQHLDYMNFDTGSAQTWAYDIFIKVNMGKQDGATTLAYAGPFVRHAQSQRPISGAAFVAPYGDKVFREHKTPVTYATSVMIHEFGHIFGFTSWDTMQRHMVKVVDNKWVWYGPKVLALAREYYNCSSLEGVPLEANKSGGIGAHWNEAVLFNELMTPMAQSDSNKLSGLSLALLEDTKWYKADYTRSEHWTYLKGQGCSAVSGSSCPTPSPCTSGTNGDITSDFKGVGYCATDGNGCNTTKKYSNRNCEVEAGWPSGNKANGAWYGDNCAVTKATLKYKANGMIYTQPGNISVWAQCKGNSSYSLWFKGFAVDSNGDKTGQWAGVECLAAGTKNFNSFTINGTEYPSSVECVDPATFCTGRFGSTVGTKGALCDKSCNSYGRCQKVNATSYSPFRLFAIRQELANYGYEAKEMATGQWQCWCYSNLQRTSGACAQV